MINIQPEMHAKFARGHFRGPYLCFDVPEKMLSGWEYIPSVCTALHGSVCRITENAWGGEQAKKEILLKEKPTTLISWKACLANCLQNTFQVTTDHQATAFIQLN